MKHSALGLLLPAGLLLSPVAMAATHIYDIQGAAMQSPLKGQTVSDVEGVVTLVDSSGFYMQDPVGDGNPATSDGIYVYTGKTIPAGVESGAEVSVSGKVTEYTPGGSSAGNLSTTEIGSPTVTLVADPAPTPVTPEVIGADGRMPPTSVIDDDAGATPSQPVDVDGSQHQYDPSKNGIDFYESLEGMLIKLDKPRVIGPINSYGEVWMLADAGSGATGVNSRGGITVRALDDGSIDFNPERVLVDLSKLGLTSYPVLQTSDSAKAVTGVVSYGFGNFRIYPTQAPETSAGSLSAQTASLPGDANTLTIGTFNVDNLSPSDSAHIQRIAALIRENLKSPDIVGLEEIEDNDGTQNDGVVSADQTLGALTTAIANAGGPHYMAATIAPENDADGGVTGGNIRQVLLFNPARTTLVAGTQGTGDATTATAPVLDSGQLALTLSPGRITPGDSAWTHSRKPLAAVFDFQGHRVLVVDNHFYARNGSAPLFGSYQPASVSGDDRRDAQAQQVHDFVEQALAVDSQADIVVMGDFNAFSWEPAMATLRGDAAGAPLLHPLDALLPATERYTYDYQGNSEALDHLLVSDTLNSAQPVFQIVHVAAEFADGASDHDPELAGFELPPVDNGGTGGGSTGGGSGGSSGGGGSSNGGSGGSATSGGSTASPSSGGGAGGLLLLASLGLIGLLRRRGAQTGHS